MEVAQDYSDDRSQQRRFIYDIPRIPFPDNCDSVKEVFASKEVDIDLGQFQRFMLQLILLAEITEEEIDNGISADQSDADLASLLRDEKHSFAHCVSLFFEDVDGDFKEYFLRNKLFFEKLAFIRRNPELSKVFNSVMVNYGHGIYRIKSFDSRKMFMNFSDKMSLPAQHISMVNMVHAMGVDLLRSVYFYIKSKGLNLSQQDDEILKSTSTIGELAKSAVELRYV